MSRAIAFAAVEFPSQSSKRNSALGGQKLSTTGTITNFKTTPGSQFDGVGGDIYEIETAGKSYSITNPDSQTLRFEVHQGDNWAGGADSSHVDRSEIQDDSTGVKTSWGAKIPPGT